MMPMRDGVRLATDVYVPKNAGAKVPAVVVKTPYNFNFWDVRNGRPADDHSEHDQARRRLHRAERASRRVGHPRKYGIGRAVRVGSPATGSGTRTCP
jgi:predicted acyl esterase